jgi:hypothetical protein
MREIKRDEMGNTLLSTDNEREVEVERLQYNGMLWQRYGRQVSVAGAPPTCSSPPKSGQRRSGLATAEGASACAPVTASGGRRLEAGGSGQGKLRGRSKHGARRDGNVLQNLLDDF